MNEEKSHVGMGLCFYCGKPDGTILLDKRLKNSLPKYSCHTYEPCAECKKMTKLGILLIECDPDPKYRTGRMFVVTEEAAERFINPHMWKDIKKGRITFIEKEVIEKLGIDKIEATHGDGKDL